ncbi:MAG TPA: hypothetical protein VLF62_02555, partial [Candidatus Saccharimonadales bacterium]|nr:hypothetical protein [Candidatus Saccharimonadales bacterium]
MARSKRSAGFTLAILLATLLIFALIGIGGWYVWQKNGKNNVPRKSTSNHSESAGPAQGIPAGWVWYSNKDMGLKIAHPAAWAVGAPTPARAVNGHDGAAFTLKPGAITTGDPIVGISSFPADADIKDIDEDTAAVRILDFKTGDNNSLTLVGRITQPSSAQKPTDMDVTNCWPRDCQPRLKNGRTLDVYLSAY